MQLEIPSLKASVDLFKLITGESSKQDEVPKMASKHRCSEKKHWIKDHSLNY